MNKFRWVGVFLLLAVLAVTAYYVQARVWAPEPIRIGILHSLSEGTMALSEKPIVDAYLLAIDEINAAGGVAGRKIEPIIRDGKSDLDTFRREARWLVNEAKVCTIFGCWTSA